MDSLIQNAAEFNSGVMEMAMYLREEGKEFLLIGRILECGSGICGFLRAAKTVPKRSNDFLIMVVGLSEEFQYLMELMVKFGVITELQSKPLIHDNQIIKEEAINLMGKKQSM